MNYDLRKMRAASVCAAALIAIVSSVALATAAQAASEPSYAVSITQKTGTPGFDPDDTPGHDSNDSNDVIRTNDLIDYKVEIRYENTDDAADSHNTTFTVDLPRGTQLKTVPPYCTTGSSLTPATIPAPPVPLTVTSWTTLPSQRLVCNLGTRVSGSTRSYPLTVRVLSWVPDGTSLTPVTPSVVSDEDATPTVSSNSVQATVSAAPNWDLSKNSVNVQENTAFIWQDRHTCSFDPARYCIQQEYPVVLGAPAGGKGTTPLLSPITFTDDLSPTALWGAAIGSQITDLPRYGARLAGCAQEGARFTPHAKIGSGTTAKDSVRDSGQITCSQPGGPGTPVEVSIADADTSLFTFPTTNALGNALTSSTAYAVSLRVDLEIPTDTITEYGTEQTEVWTLNTRNDYSDLQAQGLDGTPQASEPLWNNYRTSSPNVRLPGDFGKFFVGVPGVPNNTPPGDYIPSFAYVEGPPGGNTVLSGQIHAAPTQDVISLLTLVGGQSGDPAVSMIGCDAWDSSKLQLLAGNVPASTHWGANFRGQRFPSGGKAAWISGITMGGDAAPALAASDYTIQYSDGGSDATTTDCSAGTWYDDPALVPGNDPVLAAQGIYTGATRVRAWVNIPANQADDLTTVVYLSIHQRVAPGVVTGEIVPNHAGVLIDRANRGMQAMLDAEDIGWKLSSYNGADHTGRYGDRLIAAPSYSRILKYVKGPQDSSYILGGTGIPQATGDQAVSYRLDPSLTSAATSLSNRTSVVVEDCLPLGQSLTSSTPAPAAVVTGTTPPGAGLTCDAGETYLRWDLGLRVPNEPIDPIYVEVNVSPTTPSGTYTNTTLVTSGDEDNNDARDVAIRTDEAQIHIVAAEGIQITKQALTPYVEVNRAAEVTKDPLRWRIELVNVNSAGTLSNPDLIDRLPRNGLDGTSFTGTLEFVSAESADPAVALSYTKDPDVNPDPQAPSNGPAGTTVWCDSAAGGTVISGPPAASAADCPATAAEVTGVRLRKGTAAAPVAFPSGATLTAVIEMLPTGNQEGDVYNNCVTGRLVGLVNSVGPACAREFVVASTIGDYVWYDTNSNGLQDSGELGVPGFPVRLTGTDSDGNAVTASTATDATGRYRFDNLQSGDYLVTFDPAGLGSGPTGAETFTLRNVGPDTAIQSDGDQQTGTTPARALAFDTDDDTLDQGIVTPAQAPPGADPGTGSGSGTTGGAGTGTGTGGHTPHELPDTGADRWLVPELWSALALILLGAGGVVLGIRRRAAA